MISVRGCSLELSETLLDYLILGVKVGINLERMWGYLINLFALIEKLLFLTTIVYHPQKDSFSITSDNCHPIILIARHFLNRK